MKRVVALLAVVVMITGSISVACAEEILFRGVPWLLSVQDAKTAIESGLTKDYPTGEFEVATWKRWTNADEAECVDNVPIYTLYYEGKRYYQVADYNVAAVTLKFVPNATDGTYSDVNFDDYALYEAFYRFDQDTIHSGTRIYNELKAKLTTLYGEPAGDYVEEPIRSAFFTFDGKGCYWEGDNDTFLELRYTKALSRENVYLTYSYSNESFFQEKQNAVCVSVGDPNIDVGSIDGL